MKKNWMAGVFLALVLILAGLPEPAWAEESLLNEEGDSSVSEMVEEESEEEQNPADEETSLEEESGAKDSETEDESSAPEESSDSEVSGKEGSSSTEESESSEESEPEDSKPEEEPKPEEPPAEVKVDAITWKATTESLPIDGTFQMETAYTPKEAQAPKLVWESSNPAVASVDEKGQVKALAYGHTVISAKTEDGALSVTQELHVLYKDVTDSKKQYYFNAVNWAGDLVITKGYSDGTFGPELVCTRAHIMTFLWRMAGCPQPTTGKNLFTDVKKSAYYYKAVSWGAETQITKGYGDGTFRPDGECLREHVIMFLWRYAGCPTVKNGASFPDVSTKAYYYRAVQWADQTRITHGYSDGTFKPAAACLREHTVTFQYRYAQLFGTEPSPTLEQNTAAFEQTVKAREELDALAASNKNVLADGLYMFRSSADTTKVIAASGTNAVAAAQDYSTEQRWKITHDSQGYVTITNARTGQVLSCPGTSISAGTGLVLTSGSTYTNKWIVTKSTGSSLQLVSALSKNYMVTVSGSKLQLSGSGSAASQRFIAVAAESTYLSVPCRMQYPDLPTGCESVALTNTLLFYGFSMSTSYMADTYIPRSSYDFVTCFWGNPHSSSGNSIAAPGLAMAANKYLQDQKSSLKAYNLTGTSFTNLYSEVQAGHPVIIWTTIGQSSLGRQYGSTQYYDGVAYNVYTNSHTVVLKGFDKATGNVYLSDSISGYLTCDAMWIAKIYAARGSQAVVIK